jgi:hypothetical protein
VLDYVAVLAVNDVANVRIFIQMHEKIVDEFGFE